MNCLIKVSGLPLSYFDKIRYSKKIRGRQASTLYLENAHLGDRLNQFKLVPQVYKHQRKEDEVMIFLEIQTAHKKTSASLTDVHSLVAEGRFELSTLRV